MSSSFLVVFDTIFDENATYGDLLKLVAVLAVLVRAIFYLLEPIISWLSNGPLKQRYLRIAELEYNRSDKIEEQEMFGVTTKEEYVEHIAASLSNFLRTSITHLTGGMCTIPFLLGLTWLSTSVRISIACLGIVIEMAFEVQDFGDIVIYRLFMGAEGKKKNSKYHDFWCVPSSLPNLLHGIADDFELQRTAGTASHVFRFTICGRFRLGSD